MLLRAPIGSDRENIKQLYTLVAQTSGGIARKPSEITDEYIYSSVTQSLNNGIILIAQQDDQIIGCIQAYRLQPRIFAHMLAELTIVVRPSYQSQGLGRMLFTQFLQEVQTKHSDILRVELKVRESNIIAYEFYKKLGFIHEGLLAKRIDLDNGKFEAGIQMAWFNPEYKA